MRSTSLVFSSTTGTGAPARTCVQAKGGRWSTQACEEPFALLVLIAHTLKAAQRHTSTGSAERPSTVNDVKPSAMRCRRCTSMRGLPPYSRSFSAAWNSKRNGDSVHMSATCRICTAVCRVDRVGRVTDLDAGIVVDQ